MKFGIDARARKLRFCGIHSVLIATILVAGCKNPGPGENVICTAIFVYGLNVSARDSITGAAIASGSSMVVTDGAYRDSVAVPANRPDLDDIPLSSAGERAGNYRITLRKPGYADWTRSNVVVTADACHVKPVLVAAQLKRPG